MPKDSAQTKQSGKQRCDIWCHEYSKNFIAKLNFDISGNHVVHCPHCKHQHYRVIREGVITEDRWNSAYTTTRGEVSTWAGEDEPIVTTTAAQFMRDRWLNRES